LADQRRNLDYRILTSHDGVFFLSFVIARLSRVVDEEWKGSASGFACRGEALRIARVAAGAIPDFVYLDNE
jgi:hypothetical protein